MTNYGGSWKVIKSMIFAVIAAFITYIIYIIAGLQMGYITSECVEYIDVIDIISVDGKNTTIITDEGEMVLKNASALEQGKDGYCTTWKSKEAWRDGGE